ncbi:PEP-CTERM sorting domain-containing protein [Botrimarina sp.]|uniref:PEP-CTERM sorting domain-containing protein n=1 Tax=Botrimarina sp. TaxID=2795802 RepID=UPI0032EC37FF
MRTRISNLGLLATAAAALCVADRADAHGLQILLDSDGDGGLQAEYDFGPHPRVAGVQIDEALLWDERVRYAPNYPTLAVGGEERITWEGQDYLIQYDPAEWDNQLEWRLASESTDFPGITPLRGGFEAIESYYGDGTLDLRVNLQGPLLRWEAGAFTPAADASVSLTSQDWPEPDDGFWYVELHDEVTSATGVVSTAPYDLSWAGYDDGEHWHYLWTLNGPSDGTPAADGVYLAEYTISSGDGGLETEPMWLLLRQGVDANSSDYLAAEAAAIAAVPEPTTLAVAAAGLAALGSRRRRA